MRVKKDKYNFDLSIVTIAYNVNHDLERCLNSCEFSKISVEHIIVIPKNQKQIDLSKFEKNFKIIFDIHIFLSLYVIIPQSASYLLTSCFFLVHPVVQETTIFNNLILCFSETNGPCGLFLRI